MEAQLALWNEVIAGGVVTGSFSLGTATFGTGSFVMPVPAGASIHKAVLYSTQVGVDDSEVIAELNGVPYVFGASNIGPSYTSAYGYVYLHSIDVTADLDPLVTTYTIRVSIDQSAQHSFTEFFLIIGYDLPGAPPIHLDVYFSSTDAQQTIEYELPTSAPMLTEGGIAFATMAGYSDNTMHDCESITVNGTYIGTYQGGDFNAMSSFGTSGSFHFAHGIFTGLGDDVEDQAINGQDVLSDLSGLVQDGATSITVRYDHCPNGFPTDNLIYLMVLAYTSDPCQVPLDIGADLSACTGDTVFIDATMPEAVHLWSTGAASQILPVTQAGLYWVDVTYGTCQWRDSIQVEFKPLPLFDLGANTGICEGDTILLTAFTAMEATHIWSDDSDEANLQVTTEGTYWVHAELEGCTWTDSIVIGRKDRCGEFRLPNVFSPNGDGVNDVFQAITVPDDLHSLELTIYNRWGQVVHVSRSATFAWDARTGSGGPVTEGTYFYVIEATLSSGEPLKLAGSIMLVR